jgi:hypothetical protein
MKRSAMITWDQLRVALVILAAIGIMALAAYKLGQAANLFTRRYELIVFLPAANGLRPGGSVTLAGQLVGTVKEIQFLPVDFDTTRNLRIVARIDRSLREQIRRDSEARLRTMGLLGDKVLDISPGTPNFAVLAEGDTLKAALSLDYDAVIEKAAGAVDDMVVLTRDLRTITGGLAKGQGTMGQLLTNRAMYDQLTGAMTRANALFASLQNPNGTFGRILNDPTLYTRLSSTVTSLDSTLRMVQSSEGSMGRLLRVFLIGMRVNSFRRVRGWWPVFRAMPAMLRELAGDRDGGMIGYRLLFGGPRLIYLVQYWSSHEKLLAYASAPDRRHRPAWAAFNRRLRAGRGGVGFWHETYVVPAGRYEAVYVNMPAFGLGAATGVIPVARRGDRAEQRLSRRA